MLLQKYDRTFSYRPLDVFTLDTLLYLAYEKHWKLTETTPVKMVHLGLTNRYTFAGKPPEPAWFHADVEPSASWGDIRTEMQYEEIDLEHIGENTLYFMHWRVGFRHVAQELIVGLDRNDEYVHIERRNLFK